MAAKPECFFPVAPFTSSAVMVLGSSGDVGEAK
jgi:hypothetical protein